MFVLLVLLMSPSLYVLDKIMNQNLVRHATLIHISYSTISGTITGSSREPSSSISNGYVRSYVEEN